MSKVRVGVIGTGHLGKLHTKMLTQIPDAEFIGIYDSSMEKAAECADTYNVKIYQSLDKLLNDTEAVSIAATTSAHFEIAKKCFDKNNHIFIEKPITKSIEQAEFLVTAAQKLKLKIQVGHIERFNPALLASEKFIKNPMFIQCDRLSQFNPRGTDVAVVLDLMIHDIDIILSLIHSEVKNISASGVAVVSDSFDIANARIEFENRAVANITASRISQKKMRKMRLFQRDAYITLDFNTGTSEVYRLKSSEETNVSPHINYGEIGIGNKRKSIVYEQPEIFEINALKYELELFIKSILKDTAPPITGEDGLKALKVAEIIIQKITESSLT
jgi:predicted dehydrogenase